MVISVRCTNRACYLHTEAMLPDLVAAEILAKAHEERFADVSPAHAIMVKLTDPSASSDEGGSRAFPEPGKGGAHA